MSKITIAILADHRLAALLVALALALVIAALGTDDALAGFSTSPGAPVGR